MGEINTLIEKSIQTWKDDGLSMVVRKAGRYLASSKKAQEEQRGRPEQTFSDVLFINGCCLPHPSRYRVTHQREQLWAADVSNNEVFYTQLTMEMERMYRVFIFFRCPYTDRIGAFIKKAKADHKTVLYDIDDLMFDRTYTDTIAYVQSMPDAERNAYYEGIAGNQKTLLLCDGAVTTTERLAEELRKYVPKVYINRNVASEEMLYLSHQALEKKRTIDGQHSGKSRGGKSRKTFRKKEGKAKKQIRTEKRQPAMKKNVSKQQVRLGYFSGSITHNADLQMILPVLVKLMDRYPGLSLFIGGELQCPPQLARFGKRIERFQFGDWHTLPEKIAAVDINLAPLEQTVFNEAKSENKWIEAALVKVPTAASRVGAFAQMMEDGVTGVLCATLEEWEKKLSRLIEDAALRKKIGNHAYEYCRSYCTSVYTAARFAAYIRSTMTPNIAVILPVLQISGGALVALKHCALLKQAGYDVTVINQGSETDRIVRQDGITINVVNYWQVSIAAYLDKAVATLWSTVRLLEEYARIGQRYYHVQNFETDFYQPGNSFKIDANRTYCTRLPLRYITISKWCLGWLEDTYGKQAGYAPNGIDTARFYPVRRNWNGRKRRILIEGNSEDYYKNVDESFRIAERLDPDRYEIWYLSYQGKPKEWYHVDRFFHKVPYAKVADIYRQCDILIKSSRLESFSYPPLEMMATGGFVVAAPNGGNVEYLRDGENCLFYTPKHLQTAVQAVARITDEPQLRERLYENGIATAAARDWEKIRGSILRLYGAGEEK
ncbi:MAG: glycosyltransferase [Eubacterium sp.]|nr:glycosyltransferase [Eubacterium sp.]